IQREIENAAYEYGQSVEKQERIVVGVNKFKSEQDPHMDLMKIDEAVGQAQVERLRHIKSDRNAERVQSALGAIEEGAKGDANLMPLILEAVRAYASVGEICGTLRGVFGEYTE